MICFSNNTNEHAQYGLRNMGILELLAHVHHIRGLGCGCYSDILYVTGSRKRDHCADFF